MSWKPSSCYLVSPNEFKVLVDMAKNYVDEDAKVEDDLSNMITYVPKAYKNVEKIWSLHTAFSVVRIDCIMVTI